MPKKKAKKERCEKEDDRREDVNQTAARIVRQATEN
jgi:hypothetical protein